MTPAELEDFAQNMRDIAKDGRSASNLKECIDEWAGKLEAHVAEIDGPYIPDSRLTYMIEDLHDHELNLIGLLSTHMVYDQWTDPAAKRRVLLWVTAKLADVLGDADREMPDSNEGSA